ncbi:hypothetical protein LguiB_009789 [Lonicera macranthoides]
MSKTFFLSSNLFLILYLCSILSSSMADPNPIPQSSESDATVHIIYTERPAETEEPEAYHIRTLASVVGSEEAAKEALLYSYKHAANGFSAKLTPDQVTQMSSKPGVLQVVPSRNAELH